MQTPQHLQNTIKRKMPDGMYVRALHYKHHKTMARLRKPQKFADKIQWLKLHGNLEQYTSYVDKYEVRRYVKEKIGDAYLVPLYGVWDKFDDIDFDTLPDQFVLKATHGCGYNYICKKKADLDLDKLKKIFDAWMSENFYEQEREVQYKNCTPRIVCEAYLEDASGSLTDYKVWCAKGTPKLIQLDTDRFTDHKSKLLNVDWTPLEGVAAIAFGKTDTIPPKPKRLDELLNVAKKLSDNFPFVRVDLYLVDSKVYFGELTFTPGSGLVRHEPESIDIELGSFIDLKAYSV
jgi:hypothetical protein